jgi:hypothetical protein
MMGHLYPDGSPNGVMTEHSPEMCAAHDAGDIRTVEVRASDYFGPGANGTAHLGESFFTAIPSGCCARSDW